MVKPILARYLYASMTALLFIFSGFIIVTGDDAPVDAVDPVRNVGPVVNRTTVTVTLYEGFEEFSGEYFFGTGRGSLDLFYDPTYNWKAVSADPGAFAHNAPYALELLYDSIESLAGPLGIDMDDLNLLR